MPLINWAAAPAGWLLVPAYVGPGAGIAITFSFATVLLVVLGVFLVVLFAPLAWLWRGARGRRVRYHTPFRRVVVLGLDGLDPRILGQQIEAGHAPHFAALAREGHLGPLATTLPALTPAAWSSFMTGNDPSYHGIYDFITRDPATYLPRLSSAQVIESRRAVQLGRHRFPLARPRIRMLRKGVPFWHALARHGLQVSVLRVPITFPPEPFAGRLLAGMCVPDLLGTQGTFGCFGTAEPPVTSDGARFVPLRFDGSCARATILGPRHPFRATPEPLILPLSIERNGLPDAVTVTIGDERFVLAVGQTSDWVPLAFPAGPLRIHGLAQLHLVERDPDLRLYMSPIHIDPEKPVIPISHPRIFADYLAKRIGGYGTLGLMEDTSALNARVLDEQSFLEQAWRLFEERRAMLMALLDTGCDDVTICVFDTPDRIQHMFWRYREADHPALRGQYDRTNADAIDRMVVAMDDLVGAVRARLPDDALLLVISDHGFTGFQRGVNLNAWLHEHGYLALCPGAEPGRDWLDGVDWSRTRAYALGLSGLFLNLIGREAQGIVSPGAQAAALAAELKDGLEGLCDEERGGRRAIRRVFVAADEFQGPYRFEGPDLLIGYETGYRCAWECANGQVTDTVLVDNTRHWSGDHCVDPALVPGMLAANTPLAAANARLIDIAPTVLALFGIPPEAPMQGASLLPQGECTPRTGGP